MREYFCPTPDGKGIIGTLDDEGTVTFVVEVRSGSRIRGTTLFNEMMVAFGDEAQSIHGVWCKGAHGQPSINIDKVNELTGAGVPLDQAIRHTWTATRAAKIGFEKIRIHGEPAGKPGKYTAIDVMIEKALLTREKIAMTDMRVNPPLRSDVIRDLRGMAASGTTVRQLVELIHRKLNLTENSIIFTLAYLTRAFQLPLLTVLPIREWMGTTDDAQIDAIILPAIENNRESWTVDVQDEESVHELAVA